MITLNTSKPLQYNWISILFIMFTSTLCVKHNFSNTLYGAVYMRWVASIPKLSEELKPKQIIEGEWSPICRTFISSCPWPDPQLSPVTCWWWLYRDGDRHTDHLWGCEHSRGLLPAIMVRLRPIPYGTRAPTLWHQGPSIMAPGPQHGTF